MQKNKCQGLNEMQELTVQALERDVLGLLMMWGMNPRRYGEGPIISFLLEQVKINAGSFGGTNHRLLFMAIERLYRLEESIDVVTIHEELQLSGDSIPIQELGDMVKDVPTGTVEKAESMCKIIKSFGELRAASTYQGKPSRRLMRFREAMELELAHGAVWWTEDPAWRTSDPRGEHICYGYFARS